CWRHLRCTAERPSVLAAWGMRCGRLIHHGRPGRRCRITCFVFAGRWPGQAGQEMAGGEPAGAVRLLRRALGLWRGPALGEFAGRPFAAAEALRLDELRETALEDLFDAELALGRHHEVVGGL